MTVKQLIERLQQFDENLEMKFKSYIEIGRGGSYVEDGSLELEGNGDVVVLSVNGEEEGYD